MKDKRKLFGIITTILAIVLLWNIIIFGWMRYNPKIEKLNKAIKNEDLDAVIELLETGLDPNIPDARDNLLSSLCEDGADYPLIVAGGARNYEIYKTLFDYGATVEVPEETGRSTIYPVICTRYEPSTFSIVKLLIEKGADTSMEGGGVKLVFTAAEIPPAYRGEIHVIDGKLVFDYNEDVAKEITEIVIMLLGDESVNITTDWNQSLLMQAAESENIYLVKYLLSNGCDPKIVDKAGKTALDFAVDTGNQQVIDLITAALEE
ncbi:MAG: hypothetical protein E7627_09095 [Ruminococcaceae bacterium]|nr:hypothetical protein [Oscillospiraceae bacterium]